MADPMLAMIGAITLFVLGAGAMMALLVYSTKMFLALLGAINHWRRGRRWFFPR